MTSGAALSDGMNMEAALSQLVLDDADFTALSNRMDVYCPFEAMGAVNAELRHSNFLADLLNPRRPHGLGDACLGAFLDAVCAVGDSGLSRLEVHLADLSGAEVRREWRAIDLLLRLDIDGREVVIAVEVKVRSSEHSNQLTRYRQIVVEAFPDARHLFVFLTLNDEEPSDPAWFSLTFGTLVTYLEPAATRAEGALGQGMLTAYLAMIRRRHLTEEDLDALAERLWDRHGPALEFLTERKPDRMRSISDLVRSTRIEGVLANVEHETGLGAVIDTSHRTLLRIAVPSWDALPSMMGAAWTPSGRHVLAEVSFYSDTVRVIIMIGRGDAESRQDLIQRLRESDVPSGSEQLSKDWHTLTSKSLLKLKDDDQNDLEADADRVSDELAKFLIQYLPAYDEALRGS